MGPTTHLDLLRAIDSAEDNLRKAPRLERPITDPAYHAPSLLDNRHADVVLVEHQAGDILPRHLRQLLLEEILEADEKDRSHLRRISRTNDREHYLVALLLDHRRPWRKLGLHVSDSIQDRQPPTHELDTLPHFYIEIHFLSPEALGAVLDIGALRQTGQQAPPPPVKDTSRDRTNTESPSKAKGQHAAAHITRQLRPKVKTQLKAAAVADLPLYGAWAKAQDREETVDLTADDDELICGYRAAELRDLGLDPGVFCELPEDMRAEIIAEERQKFRQRKALHRPADTSRLRAKERDTARTASLSPGRSSRAGSAPPQPHRPLVAVSLGPRPALYKATALQEVLDTVTRWIDSRKGGPPAGKDAGKVKAYLIKCLEPGMGLGAAENAIEVLKWMRAELRDRWPMDDYETELDEAGLVWWDTWRGFVDAVNEIAVRRLGAPLRF